MIIVERPPKLLKTSEHSTDLCMFRAITGDDEAIDADAGGWVDSFLDARLYGARDSANVQLGLR